MRYLKLALILAISLSTSSCVFFLGNHGAIGYGKKIIEYNDDRTVKKETIESKSLLADIFSLSFFNRGE